MADQQRTRYYATRPRRVPPEFCSDELLEACGVLATLLLYRLISQADDQGRLPGHPKYIRAICLGLRPEITVRKVADALNELERAGFILRYDLRNRTFLQIDRWLRISRVLATLFHAKWTPCFAGNGHPVSRVMATPSDRSSAAPM